MKPHVYLLQVHTHSAMGHDTAPVEEHATETHTAAGAHHEELTLTQWLNETNLVSFTVVAIFLIFVISKLNVGAKIAAHREKLARDIETVEAQKRQAQEELEAIKKRVANLNTEVDGIINDAKKSASGLTEQILKDARAQAEKIVETAKGRVELEQRAAAKELEKRLLTDALNDARAEMARNLSGSDQKRSVETFIKELSQIK